MLLVADFFWPEIGSAPARMLSLAQTWAAAGVDVTVLARAPNSPHGRIYDGFENAWRQTRREGELAVIRVGALTSGKRSGIARRLADHLVSSALQWATTRGAGFDVVVGSAPYFAGLVGFRLARRFGSRFVYDLRDPWLAVARATIKSGAAEMPLRVLEGIEANVARKADEVVVVSERMADYMRDRWDLAKRPAVMTNGVVANELMAPRRTTAARPSTEPLVVGFIGNMGSQYDFGGLLAAARRLPPDTCRFRFIGEGGQKAKLRALVAREGLNSFEFRDPVPPAQLDAEILRCDVTICPLRSGPLYELYLPAKVSHSLALGVPVITSTEGEAADLVRRLAAGATMQMPDGAQLADCLLGWRTHGAELDMGLAADTVRQELSRTVVARCYLELLG